MLVNKYGNNNSGFSANYLSMQSLNPTVKIIFQSDGKDCSSRGGVRDHPLIFKSF